MLSLNETQAIAHVLPFSKNKTATRHDYIFIECELRCASNTFRSDVRMMCVNKPGPYYAERFVPKSTLTMSRGKHPKTVQD